MDPVASRLIVPTANYTNITPNQLSLFSFALGMASVYCFFLGSPTALVVGAILYHISFIIDCMDGKIARLKGTGSTFRVLLDISLDHIRVVLAAAALTYSQYRITEDVTYLYLGFLFWLPIVPAISTPCSCTSFGGRCVANSVKQNVIETDR